MAELHGKPPGDNGMPNTDDRVPPSFAEHWRLNPARHPAWIRYRIRELYGDTPRLDFEMPAARRLRIERLAHLDLADLSIDDELDRQTVLAQYARERLLGMPFYADRAACARADGQEFRYWSGLEPGWNGVERRGCYFGVLPAEHVARIQANMDGKTIAMPAIETVVAEYGRRYTKQTGAAVSIARRKGRSDELCKLLLRAIESGREVDHHEVAMRMESEPARPGTAAAWLEKRGPVTEEQRAATRRSVEDRVRNATPEQRAAFAARRDSFRREQLGEIAHRATRAIVSGDADRAPGATGLIAGRE